jgi:vacuolar-type H+-ATPase subunit F/Vma7
MSRAFAIGDERRLGGYALAGAEVRNAVAADDVEEAWNEAAGEATLLVLTPEAHAVLEPFLVDRDDVVWAVVPS